MAPLAVQSTGREEGDAVVPVVQREWLMPIGGDARAAAAAFADWRNSPVLERSTVLREWHDLIVDRREELARLLTAEEGKPLAEARAEIDFAAGYARWYGEEARRIGGEIIASTAARRALVLRQPAGVVGAITPCRVLLDDERVTVITFTGSTAVGRALFRGAAHHVKRLLLELGGHAPFVVFDDADLDLAVVGAVASKFRNAGQTCISGNRFIVHAAVMDAFLERLLARLATLTVGPGTRDDVDIGPLIDDAGLAKVQEHVDDARARGGTVLCGGEPLEGRFYPPTVITGATPEMKLFNEETFGPVLPILAFEDEDEDEDDAVAVANASSYGLAAYAYTTDLARAHRMAERLDYGIVGINDPVPTIVEAPFGGIKHSGLGREGGRDGISEYLETKYVSLGIGG
jgi:succinate-semialdehyde dehydrogenase/glutarate-semialdehyde dehydrogenase